MIETLGWIGTLAVLASFTMKDMRNLRAMNILACLIWVAYGIAKNDYPIVITNSAIICIHAVWFYKNLSTIKEYKLHE